jgi:hypothetical protein
VLRRAVPRVISIDVGALKSPIALRAAPPVPSRRENNSCKNDSHDYQSPAVTPGLLCGGSLFQSGLPRYLRGACRTLFLRPVNITRQRSLVLKVLIERRSFFRTLTVPKNRLLISPALLPGGTCPPGSVGPLSQTSEPERQQHGGKK